MHYHLLLDIFCLKDFTGCYNQKDLIGQILIKQLEKQKYKGKMICQPYSVQWNIHVRTLKWFNEEHGFNNTCK